MIEPLTVKRPVDPYCVTALDIETDPEGADIGTGFCWEDALGKVQYEHFETLVEWVEFYAELLDSHSQSSPIRTRLRKIYAHNGSGFDWLKLVRVLEDHDLIESLVFIQSGSNGIGFDLHIKGIEEVVHLRDSLRLMPGSLAEVTSMFGGRKKIDLSGELPHDLKRRDEGSFWKYLQEDTVGLSLAVRDFWQMVVDVAGNFGDLPMTLPALSMKLWRKTLTEPLMVSWNDDLKALERRAYSGGRTDCFQTGVVPQIRVYDLNSQYPAVMRNSLFPVSYRGFWTRRYKARHGIYEIRYVQHNREMFAVLRDEESGEFRYEGSGVYTYPEIERMLLCGGEILECKQGYCYTRLANPFRTFIDLWYGVKLAAERDGNKPLRYVAKILMNSLYGKFGQRPEQWCLRTLSREQRSQMLSEGRTFKEVGDYYLVLEDSASEYTFCGLASYVTAYARLMLLDYMDAAQENGGLVHAVDTDSVHVSGVEIETSDDLGKMKLEYVGEGAYVARKLYALKGGGDYKPKLKHKGVISKEGRTEILGKDGIWRAGVLTYNDYVRLATDASEKIATRYTTFPTPMEVLTGQREPAVMLTRVRTVRQVVHYDQLAEAAD